jgi:electron transfer flavoprotein alpha subunit
MNKILAFIEVKDNKIKNAAFEVISEAKKLSEQLNCEFSVLTVSSLPDDGYNILSEYGAGKLYKADLNEINKLSGCDIVFSYSAISKIISNFANQNEYNIILLSATSFGKELAGRIAVKTDSAYAPDVTDLIVEDGNISAIRPVYAGKSNIEIKFKTDKLLISIRPNVFKPIKCDPSKIEIENLKTDSFGITADDFNIKVKEVVVSSGKLDVAEADKIVSGGRGLRAPENFYLVENLAKSIGAAVGASRAVVDAGWRPHSEQVGQTGKTVSPSLYVACGISGAIQHLAGMSSAKCIVAINKDKDAPIFQIADYGIIGDVFEILPVLTTEFEKLMKN